MSTNDSRRPAGRLRAFLRPWLGLFAGLLLAGCIPPFPDVTDLKEVQSGEVLFVGRIELVPPLAPEEMEYSITVRDAQENQIYYWMHSKPTAIAGSPDQTEREEFLRAHLGQTVYVRAPAKRWYFSMGQIVLVHTGTRIETAWLPAGFYVDVKPGDQALYFGTIRYHRNEYFDTTKIELIDDFEKERKAFVQKFGNGMKLVKRPPQSFEIPKASK